MTKTQRVFHRIAAVEVRERSTTMNRDAELHRARDDYWSSSSSIRRRAHRSCRASAPTRRSSSAASISAATGSAASAADPLFDACEIIGASEKRGSLGGTLGSAVCRLAGGDRARVQSCSVVLSRARRWRRPRRHRCTPGRGWRRSAARACRVRVRTARSR